MVTVCFTAVLPQDFRAVYRAWGRVLAPAGLSGVVLGSVTALVRRARTDGLPVWWRCVAVCQHLAGPLTRSAPVAI